MKLPVSVGTSKPSRIWPRARSSRAEPGPRGPAEDAGCGILRSRCLAVLDLYCLGAARLSPLPSPPQMTRVRARLASGNKHKLRELRAILPGWDIEAADIEEFPDETGETFYENARAKASYGREMAVSDEWVLGEDSGLEVQGLGGRPGIRSARYAGPDATDEENVAKLLGELTGHNGNARRARYVCELVCIAPDDEEFRGSGILEGRIAEQARGSGGFGYDPVFVPVGEERTVAELGDEWKREWSHRARAAHALRGAVGAARSAL